MAGGLAALLDDIAAMARLAAASVDDVAAGAAKASTKAAGVVVDDAAVTPQYLEGAEPNRELPMIKRIATGSLRNKAIIVPVLLLLSQFAPWILTPLLMLGGTYLCFEGAEKVWEKISGHGDDGKAADERSEQDEEQVVKSAITTDFVLSCEILVISLNEVTDQSLLSRGLILVVVALLMTVVVYGAVALIVKMDDVGLHLAKKNDEGSAGHTLGRGMVKAMPTVLDIIGFVGMLAMLWVGGHIIMVGIDEYGLSAPYDLAHHLADVVAGLPVIGGLLAWLADTLVAMALGLVWGAIIVAVLHVLPFGPFAHEVEHGKHGSGYRRDEKAKDAGREPAHAAAGTGTGTQLTDDEASADGATRAPQD
ncbi:DUF808 domain-containing protein [Kytococcus sedentarius]|uniref:DUF808 domain-containing protein n=1 Tax=Kytococcus sedentarius TaxID=1276 RepID=UPI00195252AF|nr:DUF808 domain-containing protein [Kytococcus sedentarius]QRO86806.1 DUF808 domain-containing protein [Kytococcus sedentarius]